MHQLPLYRDWSALYSVVWGGYAMQSVYVADRITHSVWERLITNVSFIKEFLLLDGNRYFYLITNKLLFLEWQDT